MKRLLLAMAILGVYAIQSLQGQVTDVQYGLKYNTTTCRYDAYVKIISGTGTTTAQRTLFNSQFSVVVPTGTSVSVAQSLGPIRPSTSQATEWIISTSLINPTVTPGPGYVVEPNVDYLSITPNLSPVGVFPNLSPGMEITLFSLNVSSMANCGKNIRMWRNNIIKGVAINGGDPPSSAGGMGGGDFNNGFTLGGPTQRYGGNAAQIYPPAPNLSATAICSQGLQVDLSATTSSCQAPLTYAWTGPNGFTSTAQDVNIVPSTNAATGAYRAIVTDAFGCKDTIDVNAQSKPKAGADIVICAGVTGSLIGTDPTSGTWASPSSSLVISPTVGGTSTVSLASGASGTFPAIYTVNGCSDTLNVSGGVADAGQAPAAAGCYQTANVSLSAIGTGSWSLGAGSAGTATFSAPNSNVTNVSGFSASGVYKAVWTSNGCKDTIDIVVGDQCGCPIQNNDITATDPFYCGVPSGLVINGAAATPAAGTYLWQSNTNNAGWVNAAGTNNTQNYTTSNLTTGFSYIFRRIYTTASGLICSDTSNNINFEVRILPSTPANFTSSPTPICLGNAVTLSVTNIPGATFNWSFSSPSLGTPNSSTNTVTVTPNAAGTYSVSVTSTINGCTSTPLVQSVTVLNGPGNASDTGATDPSICQGTDGSISLFGLTAGQTYTVTYLRNGVSATVTRTVNTTGTLVIIGLTAGSYTNIVLSNAGGCSSTPIAGPIVLSDPNGPTQPTIQAIPNPVCIGNSVALTATANSDATYTWTAPAAAGLGSSTTNTNTMNPTAPGSYTVSATLTVNGCTSAPGTVTVNVLAAPATPTASSITSAAPSGCGLTDGSISISGLTPSSTYTVNYSKNSVSQVFNGTTNASGVITITGLTSGTFTNFSLTNAGGCASGVFAGPVVISDPSAPASPVITANPNPACAGNTITLTANNVTGAVYTWTFPSGTSGNGSTTNTNQFTPASAGTYIVSATLNQNGCTSGSGTVTVNVLNPPLTPTGFTADPNPTCAGTTINLNVSPQVGMTYTWSASSPNAGLVSSTTASTTMRTLVAGTYTISVTASAGTCVSPAATLQVTVNAGPAAPSGLTANPPSVCHGEQAQISLSVNNTQGATYTWTASSTNAGLVSSSANTTIAVPIAIGTYTVSVTQTINGCTSPASTISIASRNCSNSKIGDLVWNDLNGNGLQNIGEPGLAGITVKLYRSDDILIQQTLTAVNGSYFFENVEPGRYYLEYSGSDLNVTFANVGTNDLVDSDVTNRFGAGTTDLFDVVAGLDKLDMDAGYYKCNNIGSLVWLDIIKNDIWDNTENGINGLLVHLWKIENGQKILFATTKTGHKPNTPSDDGWFNFCVPPGTYYVEVVMPPQGLVLVKPNIGGDESRDSDITNINGAGTTPTFNIVSGQNKLDIGAGYYPMAVAGNLVWLDEDYDGYQGSNEAKVSDVKVEAYDAKTGVLLGESVTNSDGIYMIDYLPKGDVFYKFYPPTGYGATVNYEDDQKMNSDVDHSFGLNTTKAYTMVSGVTNPNIDMGLSFGVLPLKWDYVRAIEQDRSHLIEWKTSTEINVAYFVVERRAPGKKDFEIISKEIRANNILNVSNMYFFHDEDISVSGEYLYRIKQVDFDGAEGRSKIVSIIRLKESSFEVYPNPAQNEATIQVHLIDDSQISVEVQSITGQKIRDCIKNLELAKGSHQLPIDLQQLEAGLYNVVISHGGNAIIKRLVKI